jgi:hypothetical protein
MTTITETKQELGRIFEGLSFAAILRTREAYVAALVTVDELHNPVATDIMTELLNYIDSYLSMLAMLIDDCWEGDC